MALITTSTVEAAGENAVTITTLVASDTFVYKERKNATLILNNVTGGALTPLIVGSTAADQPCAGIGEIDLSAGFQMASVAAGDEIAIPLDSIKHYLKGTLTLTGADAMEATLLEY